MHNCKEKKKKMHYALCIRIKNKVMLCIMNLKMSLCFAIMNIKFYALWNSTNLGTKIQLFKIFISKFGSKYQKNY